MDFGEDTPRCSDAKGCALTVRVSVVTLSRNVATVIEPTIESVHNQMYRELEHVIIDGQSTDGTLKIIEARRAKVARLIVRPPRGIADAFNAGVEASSGQLIIFLNAGDTFVGPDVIERVVLHYQENGWLWAYGGARFASPDGSSYIERPTAKFSYSHLVRTCFIAHPSAVTHRDVFTRYGLFDTSYRSSMDYEFWLRVGADCPGASLPFVISTFALGGTSSDNRVRYAEDRRARRSHLRMSGLRRAALEFWLGSQAYVIWFLKRSVPPSLQMILRQWRQTFGFPR